MSLLAWLEYGRRQYSCLIWTSLGVQLDVGSQVIGRKDMTSSVFDIWGEVSKDCCICCTLCNILLVNAYVAYCTVLFHGRSFIKGKPDKELLRVAW